MRSVRLLFWLLLVPALVVAFQYVHQAGDDIKAEAEGLLGYINRNDWLAPTIGVLLVGFSVALGVGYWLLWILPIKGRLLSLRRRINRASDRSGFKAEFPNLDPLLSRDTVIGHAWREFRESLVMPRGPGNDVIRYTVRPQTYINLQCAFHGAPGLKFMSAVPGYLIGIGLLFTFIGLLAALSPAVHAVASASVQEAQKGLQGLLRASAFKFWTSIAGLLSSIVLSFVFRIYANNLEHAFESLCIAIERKMRFASAQSTIVNLDQTAAEQLSETKKINTEVAFTIGQQVSRALTEQMPAVLSQTMQPLVDEVRRSSEKIGSLNEGGIKSMMDQFSASIQGAAGTEIKQLGDTLGATSQAIQSLNSALSGAGQNLTSSLDVGAKTLLETLQQATTAFERASEDNKSASGRLLSDIDDRLRDISERFGHEAASVTEKVGAAAGAAATHIGASIEAVMAAVREQVAALSSTLERVDTTMKGQAVALGNAAEQAQAVAHAFGSVARDLPGAVAPIKLSADQFASAGQSMSESVRLAAQSIEHANRQTQTLGELLVRSVDVLRQSWEAYRGRFEKVDEDLQAAFSTMSSGLEQYQERVQGFVVELDKHFSQALARLSGAIEGMNESVEDLADSMSRKSVAAAAAD